VILGSRRPVLQAPIGGSMTRRLVLAVCEAGGVGTMAGSWDHPRALRDEIRAVAAAVDGPFAVNLVLDFPQEERAEVCAEERVPVVTLSWGIRPDLIARLRSAGATVLVQVGSVADGRAAAAAGAHGLIAQGVEAGGHVQGQTGLHVLLAGLRRACSLPLVAAGGIADEQTVAAARAAGAEAVMPGTRFVATEESSAVPAWKDLLVSSSAADTVLTTVFDVGWPDAAHRVLRNSTYRTWEAAGCPSPGSRPGEGEVIAHRGDHAIVRYSDTPPSTGMTGDYEALCLYAGQGVELIDEILPAGEVVERLANPMAAAAR
jgi:NAD(P)H-dependent flavin oxidoreductase YrpB (nitropropane dioxygenase family)